MSDGGKGSRQRPFDYDAFAANYDKIFGKERKQLKSFQNEDKMDEYEKEIQEKKA